MDYNKILDELLNKRGIKSDKEKREFLNPSPAGFYSPFLFSNMKEVVERIEKALINKEKIVIYGDYDCDGVCAVSILKLFLEKRGAKVWGFIPSRHHDGYGLTEKSVRFITKTYSPSLVITVDTGISAYKEIELFKSLGVDVIVTDHHESPEKLPECLIIDPKVPGETYPFSGLSGAGVALKLVQALSSIDESLEYIDIAAISTIGDIVPLLSENRVITVLGLKEINKKGCRPSIGYLKSKLKINSLTSTDIAFKVVPRINACGRMTSAEKCFHFLCAANPNSLQNLYAQIEEDNANRLNETGLIMDRVYTQIAAIDLNENPALFIQDKNINLGLIGIVASKICAEMNRPVFVFTEDEEGRLKASIRSNDGINIFNIIDKFRGILVDVGGHSQAGGLTIEKKYYKEFEKKVQEELKKVDKSAFLTQKELEFDMELSEKDISLELATELNKLEPYGFMNPKPVFKIKTNKTRLIPLKSVNHYKIGLSGNKEVMSFFGGKYKPLVIENMQKEIFVNIELDTFLAKPRAKAVLKHIYSPDLFYKGEEEYLKAAYIYNTYQNLTSTEPVKELGSLKEIDAILRKPFGSLVVASNKTDAKKIQKEYGYKIDYQVSGSGESMVLYNPYLILLASDITQYKNIIFLSPYNKNKKHNFAGKDVYEIKGDVTLNFSSNREVFASVYKSLLKVGEQDETSLLSLVKVLHLQLNISPTIIMYGIAVGLELGLFTLENVDGVKLKLIKNPEKKDLQSSYIFTSF